jgi:NADH dehydrogenase
MTDRPRHHAVVIGSGFGGLFAAKRLARSRDVDVTLISRTGHHLFQPLLYQVATGILSSGEIAPATREILRRARNVRVLLGDVLDVDLERRTVTSAAPGRTTVTPYDSLVVAAGAGQSYFGNDRFAEHAPGMKSIDDALELRGRIFGAFELAELTGDDEAERRRDLTFVVVGAGPTGVEMAGQIAELAGRTLRGEYRAIDPGDARIVLLDAADRVLPGFHADLGTAAQRRLQRMGVEVLLGAMVVDVDAGGIDYVDADGRRHRVDALTKIWAAGVAGNPLGRLVAGKAGAEVDRAGRVKVLPDLTLPGHPEVSVIGDLMALGLPGVAQVAIQSGTHAADGIVARARGTGGPGVFRYHDKGNMATVSRFSAIAEVGRFRFTGFLAWLAWLAIHLLYLIGFKNRVTTLLHWIVSFLGRGRAERVATYQQVAGRQALAHLAAHGDGAGAETGGAARPRPALPE